jgi:hypothetical protein
MCPECNHDGGYEPCGPYRSMCLSCGALLKNTEIEDPERIEFEGPDEQP